MPQGGSQPGSTFFSLYIPIPNESDLISGCNTISNDFNIKLDR